MVQHAGHLLQERCGMRAHKSIAMASQARSIVKQHDKGSTCLCHVSIAQAVAAQVTKQLEVT